MTPAARVDSAIGILDRVLAGSPAEQALTAWARASRYAGSGDRAAVRDHVYGALRCLRSYTAMAGAAAPSGRALMIGALRAAGTDIDAVFCDRSYAPAALSDTERSALSVAPALAEMALAVRIDCPDWLMAPLADNLGADLEAVMAAQRLRAPIFLRVNLARISRAGAQTALAAEGIATAVCDQAEAALIVVGSSNKINMSRTYLDGLVELQDVSSQAAVEALPLTDGLSVLDYCAGGGGKSLAMLARVRGDFTAHDAAPARMRDLGVRAARAGVKIRQAEGTALKAQGYDLVLVDAPCSGSGTWRRTPDAKWRLTPARLNELTALQDQILDAAAAYVRPGGHLAYMTCSLLKVENEDRMAAFVKRHSGFRLQSQRRFSPLQGGDGFFTALLTRM